MQRFITTKVLKVVNALGVLVPVLDKNGNPIPLSGYWQGSGGPHLLALHRRVARQQARLNLKPAGYIKEGRASGASVPLDRPIRAKKREMARELRKLRKKSQKPFGIAMRRMKQRQERKAA